MQGLGLDNRLDNSLRGFLGGFGFFNGFPIPFGAYFSRGTPPSLIPYPPNY
jgi:hypothetical protein